MRWWQALLPIAGLLLSGCGGEPAFTVWQAPSPAAADPRIGVTVLAEAERPAAPALSGVTLTGEPLDLAELRGQVVVVNAWASWCPPCVEELPLLAGIAETFQGSGVSVVGLNVEDSPSAARTLAAQTGIGFPSLVDPEGRLLASLPGVPPRALPSTIVIDPTGRIAARIVGPVREGVLTEILAAELLTARE